MTKVYCDLTACKYNNSCCVISHNDNECYCTKDIILLKIDEELNTQECDMFEINNDKEIECNKCQLKKYGGIKVPKKISFEIEENGFKI